MSDFSYYVRGRLHHLYMAPGGTAGIHVRARRKGALAAARRILDADSRAYRKLVGRAPSHQPSFHAPSDTRIGVLEAPENTTAIIPTETIVIDGARRAVLHWLRDQFGAEVVAEGLQGKALVRAPRDAKDPVAAAFKLARIAYRRGGVGAAHPNFIRAIAKQRPSRAPAAAQWNLDNPGRPGLIGADVHARAAWTITQGDSGVVVAVLDEGVDTLHPDLRKAVVAQKDFVDGHDHARPAENDAHGTACAGVIASRSSRYPGLASNVGLMAIRIAKSDSADFWIFDDFATADAIDWAWQEGASVLSNSWGGGPPVDVITRAFERARTKGRAGKGAVIAIAAGNNDGPISFPGTIDNVITVGASNQWDERKAPDSRDGEEGWGSNYGPELDLLAPGVRIITTDIRGARGYDSSNYTQRFNGTSAATPHVAAAAALVLSVAPHLTEKQIRDVISASAERLPGQRGWNKKMGHGRLNCYAALRNARRL
ncbi:MAG: S8 family serine peptidase [Vicinamibacteria bacterium]|nr:S8 family serine peptidase [Vicinamibacteria bacterium]